jgi:hypothetical protein
MPTALDQGPTCAVRECGLIRLRLRNPTSQRTFGRPNDRPEGLNLSLRHRLARSAIRSIPNERPYMKFISLGTNRSQTQRQPGTQRPAPRESSSKPTIASQQIHTYTELRHQIHDDLRTQHPDWVQTNGKSPICDSYESRLMELLAPLSRRDSRKPIAHPHRARA